MKCVRCGKWLATCKCPPYVPPPVDADDNRQWNTALDWRKWPVKVRPIPKEQIP